MTMTRTDIRYRVLHAFEDADISPLHWNRLVEKCGGQVFMTWHYQKVWWQTFGRGKLMIVVAYQDNIAIAIAPLFADEGMVYFVGSGGSDYLHFIGDVSNHEVLEQILVVAADEVSGFLGFLFYHVPVASGLEKKLIGVSKKMGLDFYLEGGQVAPFLSIEEFPRLAREATQKKSLLRHEAWFNRNGKVEVKHLASTNGILPWLDTFFEQHRRRWAVTPYPSLFIDDKQCLFYKRLAEAADDSDCIRFTIISFNDKPIAFHFGFLYNNTFLWYKPSFDISLAKQSPGEVLLRQLLINAIDNRVQIFDFGLGDEAFKQRFATHTSTVQNIGLYAAKSIKES